MNQVYHGDEWKDATTRPVTLVRRTRAEQQAYYDGEYAVGRITLEQWRFATEACSMQETNGAVR